MAKCDFLSEFIRNFAAVKGKSALLVYLAGMNVANNLRWHKVAESTAEIEKVLGNPCLVKAAGKEICLSVHQGTVRACAARCPHAGGYMHKGWVDPLGRVVCPLHQYKFDPTTGRNTSGEGYFIKTYPVQENDDGVFIGM